MPTISKRDLLLLMIGLESNRADTGSSGITGMTRLQKLLFLLETEANLRDVGTYYQFSAYKAGPFSAKVYDDLEYLENLGLLESASVGNISEKAEQSELQELTYETLMGEGEDSLSPDLYEEKSFRLTAKGIQQITKLQEKEGLLPIFVEIKKIKGKYGKYALKDLLYYVYTRYPEMTTESEIKDQVLGKFQQ